MGYTAQPDTAQPAPYIGYTAYRVGGVYWDVTGLTGFTGPAGFTRVTEVYNSVRV